MDYQTFSSPQHPAAFGGSGGGGFSSSAPTHSPQQQLYADPQARLQQSNPPFPYAHAQPQFANGQPGGFPPNGGSGAMMPLGGLSQSQLHHARAQQHQQQQQQQQQQHQQQLQLSQQPQQHPPQPHQQHLHPQQQPSPSPYSSAPFAQPLASPAHAPFAQNRQTASPPNATSAGSTPVYASHPHRSPSVSAPAHSQSMNPPATSQPMAMAPAKQVPPSPVSPGAQAREKQRIDTLLEINQALIQEVMELHSQGKAGHIGPAPEKADGEKQQQQQASMEYRDCMRRLQANLAFLATNAEKHTKPNQAVMPGPAIMNPPASPEQLVVLYNKLKTLFPGWSGAQSKASPGPQRLNSTASQASVQGHMQPPNSAGLHNNMNMNMSMNMQPPNSAGLPPNMQLPSNASAMNHVQAGLPSQ